MNPARFLGFVLFFVGVSNVTFAAPQVEIVRAIKLTRTLHIEGPVATTENLEQAACQLMASVLMRTSFKDLTCVSAQAIRAFNNHTGKKGRQKYQLSLVDADDNYFTGFLRIKYDVISYENPRNGEIQHLLRMSVDHGDSRLLNFKGDPIVEVSDPDAY